MVSSEFSVFSRYFFLFFLEKSSKFHKDSLIPGMDRNFDFIRNSCQQGCWRKSGFPCWLWRSSERVHVVHHEKVTAPKTNMTMEEQPFWRCISYWTWWFSIVMLISGGVPILFSFQIHLTVFAIDFYGSNILLSRCVVKQGDWHVWHVWHGSLCQPSPIVAINKSLKTASTSSISAHPDCELMSRQPIWNRFGPNFREHVEDYDAFSTAVGGSYHLNKTLPPNKNPICSTVAGLGEFETAKRLGFLGVWFVGPRGCPVHVESSRKARWIRFGGKLQQTNKNDVRKDLFVSSPTSTWTKKYHSFGGNDSQPAICKCEKKLQLLDVVLRCSQREDVFGWLLHLGSWWNLVR